MQRNKLEDKVFKMYRKERIGTKKNHYCESCKKSDKRDKLAGPISFFHIGSKFEKDRYKIVFVGKNSWYDKKDFKDEAKGMPFADARKTGMDSIKGEDEGVKSAYWNYMRAIIEKLYNPNNAFENVAITNIIKCNTSAEEDTHRDTTPVEIKKNCIDSKIFEKEIKILKPKHIIFFTGKRKEYDEYIKKFNFGKLVKDGKKKTKDKGKLIWWEREFVKNGRKIKVLRTSHPQGQHKEIFVKEIVNWIKKG